jgi:hypothetical protein
MNTRLHGQIGRPAGGLRAIVAETHVSRFASPPMKAGSAIAVGREPAAVAARKIIALLRKTFG